MFSMSRSLKVATLAVSVALVTGFCIAADKERADKKSSEPAKPASKETQSAAFLGLLVEELPPAFASQLPSVVSPEQGVLVVDVTPESPAAKAGIKPHDILLTYDDQKLFAAKQLIKLVHSDKPGRKVKLELIRAGKSQCNEVTLGERPAGKQLAAPHVAIPHRIPRFPSFGKAPPTAEKPSWSSFDSLTLKKLDDNRFHASIRHTDKAGKMQKHEFEGTTKEIQQQITDDKDLLPDERTNLLRGLDLEAPELPLLFIPSPGPLGEF